MSGRGSIYGLLRLLPRQSSLKIDAMRREPLSWYPTEDGDFRADWPLGYDDHQEVVIEPHLVRTYSQSKGEYTGEPWLAWMVRWGDRYLTSTRTHSLFYDSYDSPIFSLGAAMRKAERVRYAVDWGKLTLPRLRSWLGIERIHDALFERWLRRQYPPTSSPFVRRTKRDIRTAGQWQRMVDGQTKKRLEQEGREPIRITDY